MVPLLLATLAATEVSKTQVETQNPRRVASEFPCPQGQTVNFQGCESPQPTLGRLLELLDPSHTGTSQEVPPWETSYSVISLHRQPASSGNCVSTKWGCGAGSREGSVGAGLLFPFEPWLEPDADWEGLRVLASLGPLHCWSHGNQAWWLSFTSKGKLTDSA